MVKFGAFVDSDFLKTCPDGRMIDFRSVARVLCLSIGNPQAMIEELMMEPLNGNVRKSVDCSRQHRTAVNLEVLGKVRAAPQETDTHRCLSDDHY